MYHLSSCYCSPFMVQSVLTLCWSPGDAFSHSRWDASWFSLRPHEPSAQLCAPGCAPRASGPDPATGGAGGLRKATCGAGLRVTPRARALCPVPLLSPVSVRRGQGHAFEARKLRPQQKPCRCHTHPGMRPRISGSLLSVPAPRTTASGSSGHFSAGVFGFHTALWGPVSCKNL